MSVFFIDIKVGSSFGEVLKNISCNEEKEVRLASEGIVSKAHSNKSRLSLELKVYMIVYFSSNLCLRSVILILSPKAIVSEIKIIVHLFKLFGLTYPKINKIAFSENIVLCVLCFLVI